MDLHIQINVNYVMQNVTGNQIWLKDAQDVHVHVHVMQHVMTNVFNFVLWKTQIQDQRMQYVDQMEIIMRMHVGCNVQLVTIHY